MTLAIARPYAEAAFRFAKQSGELAHWQDFLSDFSTLSSDPKIAAVINNPLIEQAVLAEIFFEQSKGKVNQAQHNFLMLLATNRRLAQLSDIADCFEKLRDQDENILRVHVKSAYALDTAAQTKLQEKLKIKWQKTIKMETAVDANLIGGLQIRVGDQLLDASLRGQLKQLNQDLSRGS